MKFKLNQDFLNLADQFLSQRIIDSWHVQTISPEHVHREYSVTKFNIILSFLGAKNMIYEIPRRIKITALSMKDPNSS